MDNEAASCTGTNGRKIFDGDVLANDVTDYFSDAIAAGTREGILTSARVVMQLRKWIREGIVACENATETIARLDSIIESVKKWYEDEVLELEKEGQDQ